MMEADRIVARIGGDTADLAVALNEARRQVDAFAAHVRRLQDVTANAISPTSFREAIGTIGQAGSAMQVLAGQITSTGHAMFTAAHSALAFTGVTAVVTGLISGFNNLQSAVFGTNAQMETLETQFTNLLGSAEAARAQIAMLAEFAAKTPFELGEVAQASRWLQTFGGAALNTAEMLTMIGNAAAMANRSFSDVAMAISIVYQRMQGGQPLGEPLERLRNMNVLLPETLNKLEQLSQKGGDWRKVWDEIVKDLSRPELQGSMEKLSQTFHGLTTTIQDNINLNLADAFYPVFELVRDFMKWLADATGSEEFAENMLRVKVALTVVTDAIRGAVDGFRGLVDSIGAAAAPIMQSLQPIGDLAQEAHRWGQNFITMFIEGISSGLDALTTVITTITNLITFWFAPGSPPRIAPNIDKYGAAMIEEWMKGFTKADFSAFSELSGEVERLIRRIGDRAGKPQLLDYLLRSREAVAQSINEWKQLGSVSEESLDRIAEAAGPAGDAVRGLARSYGELYLAQLDVERITRSLTELQREQEAALRPLNAELAEINDLQAALSDERRRAEAGDRLRSGKMGQEEFDLLIRELDVRKKIREEQAKFRPAIEAAKDQLDAARRQLDSLREQYDTQTALNRVQDQTNKIIEEFTKSAGGASNAAKDLAKSQEDAALAAERLKKAQEDAAKKAEELQKRVAAVKSTFGLLVESDPEKRIGMFNVLAEVTGEDRALQIANLGVALQGLIGIFTSDSSENFEKFKDGLIGLGVSGETISAIDGLANSLGNLKSAIEDLWNRGQQLLAKLFRENEVGFREAGKNIAAIGAEFDRFWTIVQPLVPILQRAAAEMGKVVAPILVLINPISIILAALSTAPGAIGVVVVAITGALRAIIGAAFDVAAGIAQMVAGATQALTYLGEMVSAIFEGQWAKAWAAAEQVAEGVLLVLEGLVRSTTGAMIRFFANLMDTAIDILEQIAVHIDENAKNRILDVIIGIWNGVLDSTRTVWTSVKNAILEVIHAIEAAWRKFYEWWQSLGWSMPGAPKPPDSGSSGSEPSGSEPSGSGGSSGFEGRASGGVVWAGTPYWVGERGPEVFVPRQSGMVMPASRSVSIDVGGITVPVTIGGSGPISSADLDALRQSIAEGVLDALVSVGRSLAPGGT